MKILCTGMTARMVGSTKIRGDYLTFSTVLVDALRTLGHDVEIRNTEPGESFDQYDRVFAGIALLSSLGSRHAWRVAKVMELTAPRCILYCDDWSIEGAAYDWNRKLNVEWDKYLKLRTDVNALSPANKELMNDVLNSVLDEKLYGRTVRPWKLLAPMFPWGDHSKILGQRSYKLNVELHAVDPSPVLEVQTVIRASTREKAWVSATLQNHDVWLKSLRLKWPITELGNKRKDQVVVTEGEVLNAYANNWGVLCPKYANPGSGWWRARFNYSAALGSILHCDPRDGECIGPSYLKTPFQIERMDDLELTRLAGGQTTEFYSKIWTRAQFYGTLAELLR